MSVKIKQTLILIGYLLVSFLSLPTESYAKASISVASLFTKTNPNEAYVNNMSTMLTNPQFVQNAGNAVAIAKTTLTYFTNATCSGVSAGTYTTPSSGSPPSFPISMGVPFGVNVSSAWAVGAASGIADMTTVQSIAITLYSTTSDVPQANFAGQSFACLAVTCFANTCASADPTKPFGLKTTAAIGDPASGGVVACMGGGLNNLIAPTTDSANSQWAPLSNTGATSTTDGATNTATINAIYPGPASAAGICNAYATATGGYTTGWFLPAQTQLSCLFTNRVAITGFSPVFYWSSTELTANNASVVDFAGGALLSRSKTLSLALRCARNYT